MSQGEGEKAVKIMKRIARLNGREVPQSVYRSVMSLCLKQKLEAAESNSSLGYGDLFRSSSMRRITILMTLLWMLICLQFDAHVRNIANLDFSIYWSFMISAGLELPADLLSIVGLELLGRRWSSTLSLLASGLAILPCAWLTERPAVQAVLAMVARFFATYAMNTGFQFTVEVLPTQLRGQGMALVNVMSMFSQMASPVFVYSSVVSEGAPFLLIALVCLLASIPGRKKCPIHRLRFGDLGVQDFICQRRLG